MSLVFFKLIGLIDRHIKYNLSVLYLFFVKLIILDDALIWIYVLLQINVVTTTLLLRIVLVSDKSYFNLIEMDLLMDLFI